MTSPFFSPASRRDLCEILNYIARDNPQAAAEFIDKLEEKCRRLADIPEMGFHRDDLAPKLRAWPVGNYVIFYRSCDGGIEVVRVIHGARDLGKLFD